jgi:hypothetical protein
VVVHRDVGSSPVPGLTAKLTANERCAWLSATTYVKVTYLAVRHDRRPEELEEVRRRLVEAEAEYQRARVDNYVARQIRDAAIVDAHREGLSSREISELVGDIGQPNVVRVRRRAIARRDVVPHGLLSAADAVRASGLGPAEFIALVREGRLRPLDLPDGVRAFRAEDVANLTQGS